MANIGAVIQYDGTGYHGWQRQNNALAVSQVLEEAIGKVTGHMPTVTGCSRTDAGVHALQYVCSFSSQTRVPMDKLPIALNTKLPADIRVLRCAVMPDDFHARFSARGKTYLYQVDTASIASPFWRRYSCHFPYAIDLTAICSVTGYFEGTHDFSAFMATGSNQKTTVRTVKSLTARRRNGLLQFEITADAYLYNMVRIIAGTLLYVGCGKIAVADVPGIIAEGDRRRAGITAPPQGLFLKEIFYDRHVEQTLLTGEATGNDKE